MKNWLLAGCLIFSIVWLSLFVIPVPDQIPDLRGTYELGALGSVSSFSELWSLFPTDLVLGIFGLLVAGLLLNARGIVLPERTLALPDWGYDGIVGTFVWILAGLGTGFATSKLAANVMGDPFYFRWSTSFALQVTLLLSVPLLVAGFGESFGESLDDFNSWLGALTHGTIEYVRIYPILLLALMVNQILLLQLDFSSPSASYFFIRAADSGPKFVLLVVLTCLLAPLGEELFFRGIFYRSLRNPLNQRPAAAVGGLVFALVHFDARLFLPLVVLGYLLCVIYEKSGSIKVVITMHFLQNTISLIIFHRLL